MAYPLAWLILAAALVICLAIWLRRQRDRFIAELAEQGDPLADGPKDKTFRRAFQNWLLGHGAQPSQAKSARGDLFILLGAIALMGLGLLSLLGGSL